MNRERIRQIAEDIAGSYRFDMALYWFTEPHSDQECGTPACIAGFACVRYMGGHDMYEIVSGLSDEYEGTHDVAQSMLGLTDDQAEALFDPQQAVHGIALSAITADMAVRTLHHLAETGDVRWHFNEE